MFITPRIESNDHALNLKSSVKLSKFPAHGVKSGEPAQPLTRFQSDSIYSYCYTRDGKNIILAPGKVVVNVALIKGFL
jgi:hypothetical protein